MFDLLYSKLYNSIMFMFHKLTYSKMIAYNI